MSGYLLFPIGLFFTVFGYCLSCILSVGSDQINTKLRNFFQCFVALSICQYRDLPICVFLEQVPQASPTNVQTEKGSSQSLPNMYVQT